MTEKLFLAFGRQVQHDHEPDLHDDRQVPVGGHQTLPQGRPVLHPVSLRHQARRLRLREHQRTAAEVHSKCFLL